MKTQHKLEARERIKQILAVALPLASKVGYTHVTREAIAASAGIPASLISYHMGTMPDLRRHIMREALRVECLPVIAQGIVARDRHALKAPSDLREKALAELMGA